MKKKKQLSIDQFEDMKKWLSYYETYNKFPHDKIMCSKCKSIQVSLKGRGKKVIFDACDSDPKRILTETVCKLCKEKFYPTEKKKKEYVPETLEERERRIEEIRASLPKIDLNKERIPIDLLKNEELCKEHTKGACLRPDIYLNNDRTCDTCALRKNCSCGIKKFSKFYEKGKK
jgi:hypothetical protein